VSIPTRECIGAQECPYGEVCFVEEARARGRKADLVVTNHALLAIDAIHGNTTLPEHGAVVIDEAHELVARVTSSSSQELSPQLVDRVARRALPWLDDDLGDLFEGSADVLEAALDDAEPGRLQDPESAVVTALAALAGLARRASSALESDSGDDLERVQTQGAVQEVFDIATRMAALDESDVVWVSERDRFGRQLVVAPLSVTDVMREKIFSRVTGVLTSATLKLGGGFGPLASQIGFRAGDQLTGDASADTPDDTDPAEDAEDGDASERRMAWRGLDVGSPFDYRAQGICYIAKDLPKPGRDGIGEATLAEIAELVWAAGGRTLGPFASQRSAEVAAAHVRAQLPDITLMCQGEANLPELTQRFLDEPTSCLFGTISLWQGVDLPGSTCQLVIMDKIPFPRPDDPLTQARQQAVAEHGGNGFMRVAATGAGLLLAQGSGRLIRRLDDRGVVAILDPRLVTARYGSFLRKCLPDFWTTTDREVAIQALRRLHAAACSTLR
jgi:ATP-dependent DNA helicase DinG